MAQRKDIQSAMASKTFDGPYARDAYPEGLGGDWTRDVAQALKGTTGTTWHISLSDDAGEPSLLDQEKMAEQRVRADVLADPNVRAVMDAFPEAELESFSTKGA